MGATSFTIELRPGGAQARIAQKRDAVATVLRDDLAEGLAIIAARTADRAASFTPEREGTARAGWRVERGGDRYTYRVTNRLAGTRRGLAKLLALEFGSPPHVIVARRARVLRLRDEGGDVIFRRRVRHPGNRAYAMMRLARAMAAADLDDLRKRLGRDAVRAWGAA